MSFIFSISYMGEKYVTQTQEIPSQDITVCYDTTRTRLTGTSYREKQMVLVTAMAPNRVTDKSGKIEAVKRDQSVFQVLPERHRRAGPYGLPGDGQAG